METEKKQKGVTKHMLPFYRKKVKEIYNVKLMTLYGISLFDEDGNEVFRADGIDKLLLTKIVCDICGRLEENVKILSTCEQI